ncbi:hypothetical protein [Micromonospora haikouensis]|uniref:hypothetical protein n=1 Tax=Micromonospora haikouensis TaxID=686309 RepID=UPI003D74E94D
MRPRFLGRPFFCWSLAKLRDYLIDAGYVTATSVETLRRILHEGGVSWQASTRPRLYLNTMRTVVVCDPLGRLLFCGERRPGSMYDITQARTRRTGRPSPERATRREILADAGYQLPDTNTGGAVIAPQHKPRKRWTLLPPSVIEANEGRANGTHSRASA